MKAVKCPKCGARLVDEYCVWGHGIFGERAEAARRDYWGDDNDSGSELAMTTTKLLGREGK